MNVLKISTAALPPAQRVEAFCEAIGRKILRIAVEPEPDTSFKAEMTLQSLPGLGIGAASFTPMRARLTPELIDNDDLVLVIVQAGDATAWQRGREEALRHGQAIVTANEAPARTAAHTATQVVNLRFERKNLAPRLADVDSSVFRLVSRDNQALRLLTSYVHLIGEDLAHATPDLQRVAVDHIHDLAALALGATRDAAEIARGRGVRIARLHAIKADISANVAADWLSADAIAARHGVSARYIRALFQGEETTFTDFVLSQRLARAYNLLVAARLDTRSISAIAFEAGFEDLSYFNRCFRQRYGATPSDIRAAAWRQNG